MAQLTEHFEVTEIDFGVSFLSALLGGEERLGLVFAVEYVLGDSMGERQFVGGVVVMVGE